MDAARAAKRLPGVEKVSVVYRRTRRYMPADEEELLLAVQDGVEFREQLAPVKYENGTLSCRRTVLGEPDASGRRSPVETDETVAIAADAVIAAVGGRIDENFFKENGIGLDERGPATIVEAIADATRAAGAICDIHNSNHESLNINPDDKPAHEKKGVLCTYCSARGEGGRCLECATVCENCVDVCPNRANVSVLSGGSPQIIHLDGLCNECGNCATFCPYSSAPYRDKFTLFNTQEDFEASENQGFLPLDAEGIRFRVRLNGRVAEICAAEPGVVSEELRRLMLTVLENYRYILPV
jgi:putative selenate reductase